MSFCNDLCESIRGICRDCMTTPFTRKRALIVGGIVLVIIIIIIIIVVACSGKSGSSTQTTGTDVIKNNPFVIGGNGVSELIKKTYHNQINGVSEEDLMAKLKANTDDLIKGYVATQIWDVGATDCTKAQYHDAVSQTLTQIDLINRLFQLNTNFTVIKSSTDISNAKKNKKIGAVLRVDGGYALDAKLSILRTYYNLGVRILALVGKCDTPWGPSAWTSKQSTTDLDAFGNKIIEEMGRLGMIIDISGATKKVQLSIMAQAKTANVPVMISNSGLTSISDNPNNVDKEVLTALKERTGIMTLSLAKDQVCAKNAANCTMTDVIAHLKQLKDNLGDDAAKYILLGSNFGSDNANQYPSDLDNPSKFGALFDKLLKPAPSDAYKWSTNDLKLMAGENFIQLLTNVEKAATAQETAKKKPLEDLIDNNRIPAPGNVSCSMCYTDQDILHPK